MYQRVGLFNFEETKIDRRAPPVELYKNGCISCPLHQYDRVLKTPKMNASGSGNPIIYALGEAPGEQEDTLGRQFVGASGVMLRHHLPSRFNDIIRWNNTISCRPPDNRNPTNDEIEFCRSRVVADIEATQPDAIFGFGGIPLLWTGRSNTFAWRGRHFPIQVGGHRCRYFSFHHPAYLLRMRNENDGRPSSYELAFKLDMERAIKLVLAGLSSEPPAIHTVEDARSGITTITGNGSINDLGVVLQFLREAAQQPRCGLDYETQGLRPYAADAAILSVAIALPGRCLAFALDHPQAGWSDNDKMIIKNAFKEFLLSPVHKCSHSLHFEMEWSAFYFGDAVLRASRWEDSLTQAYILDERKDGFALDFLTQLYFGINIKKITGSLNKNNMKSEPIQRLLPYNGIDAKYHLLVFNEQEWLLEDAGLQSSYEEKLRQIPTCVLTQLAGLPVDYDENLRQQHDIKKKIRTIEEELFDLPEVLLYEKLKGQKFNPGSDKEVLYLLKSILNKGVSSTDKAVLEELGNQFGKLQIEWRHFSKMLSTYVDRFNEENAYPDKLYHVSLGTVFTDTGRLNGDFQNVPKRGEEVSTRRQIAGEGTLVSFDYGQIEARLIACASRDPAYCKATWDGLDVHGYWAKRISRAYPQAVGGEAYLDDPKALKKFRDIVKNKFVFPLFFSASLRSVSGYLNIPEDILAPEHDKFWQEYQGVKDWQQTLLDQYKRLGYTECMNGRRRRAPLGLGQVVNSMIQGSAADIVMDGYNRLSEKRIPALQPRLQIHDDLLFYFETKSQLEDYVPVIIEEMLNVRFPWIIVPLTVEMSQGSNWCDMEPVETFSSYDRLDWPQRRREFV
jgi:uracil-DNA glycosylase family 4